MISEPRVRQVLNAAAAMRIGLVGDLFLDRYLDLAPNLHELSIETGLEAYQVTTIRNRPGALGTIINNLAALGAGQLVPATVIGDDGQAYDLLKELQKLPVDARHVLQTTERLTPTYTKPMRRDVSGTWRELNRIDLRNRAPLSAELEARFMQQVSEVFHATDGLIVLDQVNEEGWGVIGPRVREHLAQLAASQPDKLVFIDSRAHIAKFGFGILKPNVRECLAAAGLPPAEDETQAVPEAAAQALAGRTSRPVFCTLGERGMLVVQPTAAPRLVPAYQVTGPVDIVGAGDSATAGIVMALLSGADPLEAAAMGNLVASITVQQLGTTGVATPAQVLARWQATH